MPTNKEVKMRLYRMWEMLGGSPHTDQQELAQIRELIRVYDRRRPDDEATSVPKLVCFLGEEE